MAIPDTGNPGSIYSQARELAKNGSPVTDRIDAAVDTFGNVTAIMRNIAVSLVKNWKIALVAALEIVILLKRL